MQSFSLTKKDFKIDWFSGTGAGGQHRNKHQNCVRITHIDTGFMETGQNHRERSRNFEEAFKRLAYRVVHFYYKKADRERRPVEEVVRTYNMSENRVTDHASSEKQPFKGFDLDKAIRSRKKHQTP